MKLLQRAILLAVCFVTFFSFPVITFSQSNISIVNLKQKLKQFETRSNYLNDTAYANTIIDLGYLYSSSNPDSAILLLKENAARCKVSGYKMGEVDSYIFMGDASVTKGEYAEAMENYGLSLQLAKKINYQKAIALILNRIGIIHLNQGTYAEALSKFYESLKAGETDKNNNLIGATLNNIAVVQFYQGKLDEAQNTYLQRLKIAQKTADTSSMSIAFNGIGEVNLQQKEYAKALQNITNAYNLAKQIDDREMILTTMLSLAEAYYTVDSLQKSDSLYNYALQLSQQSNNNAYVCNALTGLAKTKLKENLLKDALANSLQALQKAKQLGQVQLIRDASQTVSSVYEAMNDGVNALKYFRIYKTYSDSMNNLASQRAVAIEKASYEFSKKESEFQRKSLQQQWIIISALSALLLVALFLWFILRSRNRLNSTYKVLQQKNLVIESQRIKAEETLQELKTTQTQLIQSEKMASLGELTAGIAHEIQNPLNFVNNFSEINIELIDELKAERVTLNAEEQDALLNDIIQNNEKINFHGKRADSIVKSMLQHSRKSKGIKEPTDINALCDEYLRLSYHGLRAKDKLFNADFKTDFDESIGKINIIRQDVGRVLLNTFNNAFYAVNEKQKLESERLKTESLTHNAEYKPIISVTTKKLNSLSGTLRIEIKIADNGIGIPQNIIDKIFQPFFTTKPTGQGTGLGLSLAYDIITKEHNGTIKAESNEGESTIFIINLPAA